MATYGVFESVNMKSTKGAERIFDVISASDIENGTFGYLNGLATNESVVYNFVAGTSAGKEIVVVDQPAWTEDESLLSKQRKDQFIIPAGTKFRVRVIAFDDEFAINSACVTTATQAALLVSAYLTIDASTGKLVAAATAATTPAFEATVMRKRVQGATLVTAANTYGYSRDMFEAKVTTLA
jgi:hypothetical protein